MRGQYHEPDFFNFTLTWAHKPSSIPKVWAVWGPSSMDSATMNKKCSGLEWISRPAIHGTVDAMRTVDICPDPLTKSLHSILAWWVGTKKMMRFVHLASSLAEYQKGTIEHFKVPLHNTYNEQELGGWLFSIVLSFFFDSVFKCDPLHNELQTCSPNCVPLTGPGNSKEIASNRVPFIELLFNMCMSKYVL